MTEAPERIWMDPDIKFPECEKQYGCDVEYVRADMLHEIFCRYSKAETHHIEQLQERVAELEAVLQGMIGGKIYVVGHGSVETNESRAARAALKGKDDG